MNPFIWQYDYKKWRNLPHCSYGPELNDCTTVWMAFKDEELQAGDMLKWNSQFSDESETFTVDHIRLNPTPRVYNERTGQYYLLHNCIKLSEKDRDQKEAVSHLKHLKLEIQISDWWEIRRLYRMIKKAKAFAKHYNLQYHEQH